MVEPYRRAIFSASSTKRRLAPSRGSAVCRQPVALRINLRRFNLYDTKTREPETPSPGGRDVRTTRRPNGSYSDLGQPSTGMAGTRFGRNVALASTVPDQQRLLDPKLQLISRRLLTRDAFIPASTLSVFAGAPRRHRGFDHGATWLELSSKVEQSRPSHGCQMRRW